MKNSIRLRRKCKACGSHLDVRFDPHSLEGWKYAYASWKRWRRFHSTFVS